MHFNSTLAFANYHDQYVGGLSDECEQCNYCETSVLKQHLISIGKLISVSYHFIIFQFEKAA